MRPHDDWSYALATLEDKAAILHTDMPTKGRNVKDN